VPNKYFLNFYISNKHNHVINEKKFLYYVMRIVGLDVVKHTSLF